jgi:hypothetical protein
MKSYIISILLLSYFIPHEFKKNGEISILQMKSYDNNNDLFIKSLLNSLFHNYVNEIGMKILLDLQNSGWEMS